MPKPYYTINSALLYTSQHKSNHTKSSTLAS